MKQLNLDLSIKSNAKDEDWERYEAVLISFGNFLFQNNIGEWGGRETSLSKNMPIARTNYWYILDKRKKDAIEELKRLLEVFQLSEVTKIDVGISEVTKIDVGNPYKDSTDFKKKLEKKKQFTWTYQRERIKK